MDVIGKKIHKALEPYGYKSKTVAITHLPEVQEEVGKLVRQGLIDRRLSEKWHFYLETNQDLPEAKTIIIAALPQPVTRLSFAWQGSAYPAEVAPGYFYAADETRAEEIINKVLGNAGYKVSKARLALKTLAVRSGLARYGRNNLAYVPGMGSFGRLIAFYSDAPCEEDNWQASGAVKTCENCTLCRQKCTTGSITADRFLIHAENCLGFLSEIEPDVPRWVRLQPDWPNAFIGCRRCQSVCPANKPYLQNIKIGPSFSEDETAMVLHKTPWEKLSLEARQKLEDVRGVYPLLARNLSALIEKQQQARQK
jgi:epoxyqueuosine reductase